MTTPRGRLRVIEKEMGITHKDFFAELPHLLKDIQYQQNKNTIKFQLEGKNIEITLGPEEVREISSSLRLPVIFVSLRFFGFSEEEICSFIRRFNLRFMKGGG